MSPVPFRDDFEERPALEFVRRVLKEFGPAPVDREDEPVFVDDEVGERGVFEE
jgi:hypothetical protein